MVLLRPGRPAVLFHKDFGHWAVRHDLLSHRACEANGVDKDQLLDSTVVGLCQAHGPGFNDAGISYLRHASDGLK